MPERPTHFSVMSAIHGAMASWVIPFWLFTSTMKSVISCSRTLAVELGTEPRTSPSRVPYSIAGPSCSPEREWQRGGDNSLYFVKMICVSHMNKMVTIPQSPKILKLSMQH